MSTPTTPSEYLVISRGQWDPARSPEEIQTAIDQFYLWLDRLVREGKMKTGQRLGVEGKTVARNGVTDGPFGEAKEVIGGYWFIVAGSRGNRPGQSLPAVRFVLRNQAHRSTTCHGLFRHQRNPHRPTKPAVTVATKRSPGRMDARAGSFRSPGNDALPMR